MIQIAHLQADTSAKSLERHSATESNIACMYNKCNHHELFVN